MPQKFRPRPSALQLRPHKRLSSSLPYPLASSFLLLLDLLAEPALPTHGQKYNIEVANLNRMK